MRPHIGAHIIGSFGMRPRTGAHIIVVFYLMRPLIGAHIDGIYKTRPRTGAHIFMSSDVIIHALRALHTHLAPFI